MAQTLPQTKMAGVCSVQTSSWVRAWPHDAVGFDGLYDLGVRTLDVSLCQWAVPGPTTWWGSTGWRILGGCLFEAELVMGPGLTPRRGGVRRGRGFGQASVRGRPHHGSGPGPTTWWGSTGGGFWVGVCSRHPSTQRPGAGSLPS